jgi:hypothetical protein
MGDKNSYKTLAGKPDRRETTVEIHAQMEG